MEDKLKGEMMDLSNMAAFSLEHQKLSLAKTIM